MLNKMRIIKNILIDELRFISKDIDVLMIILIAPMVYAFFYGSIYLNKSEADVPVVIIDNNNSEISRQLIRELDSHQLIKVKYLTGNFNEAKELLNNGEIEGIIIFPEEMSVDLKKGLGAEVKVYLNTSRFLVSNDLNKGINEVIGYFNASVRLNYFLSAGLSSEQALETIEPIRAEIKPMYNFTDNYGDFLIPAIFILILQQTLLIGLAESFTKQRQKNTLHKVFDMAEGKIRYIIFGKGFFYILLYSAYALFFFTITFYTFSLSVKGNIFLLLSVTILFLYSITAFTFFIATFFKQKITALYVLTFSSYPIFLISGYTWPIEAMPWFLRIISNSLPSTPFFSAYTKIALMGSNINAVIPDILHLVILATAWTIIATIKLKLLSKNIQRDSVLPECIS